MYSKKAPKDFVEDIEAIGGIVHPSVKALVARGDIEQRTPAWYEARRNLLTASDVASVLGILPFKSYAGDIRADCLQKKLDNLPFSNIFCRHGQKYEDEAIEKYCAMTGDNVFDFGLTIHQTETWLGASPDGVTLGGRLIEVKCPMGRKIVPGHPPHHYYPQMQVQMEVLDFDSVVFIQYRPGILNDDGKAFMTVDVIERDRQWFERHKPAMHAFWKEYTDLLETHVPAPPPPQPTCLVIDALYD